MLACNSALFAKIPGTIPQYLQFALEKVGDLSACLWAAVLSGSLLFIECQSWKLLSDLQPVFLLLCIGFVNNFFLSLNYLCLNLFSY